jgi:hypothetical protein
MEWRANAPSTGYMNQRSKRFDFTVVDRIISPTVSVPKLASPHIADGCRALDELPRGFSGASCAWLLQHRTKAAQQLEADSPGLGAP